MRETVFDSAQWLDELAGLPHEECTLSLLNRSVLLVPQN